MSSSKHRWSAWLLLIAAAACSDTPTEPEAGAMAGSYSARGDVGVLEAGGAADAADLLAEGAYVRLVLEPDGDTAGEVSLRAGSGATTTVDLTGTWRLDGDSVLLDHRAETFLRDMRLRYDSGRLSGAATSPAIDGRRVHVILVRE